MPWSRILRMIAISSLMSGAVRPAAGSSSSSSFGSSASARRDLEQALLAVGQVARLLVARVPRGRRTAAGSPARAAAPPPLAPSRAAVPSATSKQAGAVGVVQADQHVLDQRSFRRTAARSGTCARCRARRCRGDVQPAIVWPSNRPRRRSARRCRSARSSSCSCPSRSGRSGRGSCRARPPDRPRSAPSGRRTASRHGAPRADGPSP